MAKKANRKCIICGKLYNYCPNCSGIDNRPLWYASFDSEQCKDIFDIASKHRNNKAPIEELYKELSKYNINDVGSEIISPSVREDIEQILQYKTPIQKEFEKMEEVLGETKEDDDVEETTNEEEPIDIVDETKEAIEEKVVVEKKKNYGNNYKNFHKKNK